MYWAFGRRKEGRKEGRKRENIAFARKAIIRRKEIIERERERERERWLPERRMMRYWKRGGEGVMKQRIWVDADSKLEK